MHLFDVKLGWVAGILKEYWEVVLIILFGVLLILGVTNLTRNRKISKLKEKCKPYNFDYQKKFSIYKMLVNGNKKIKNDEMKFSKYSEWRRDILNRFIEQMKCDDFYRFLRRELRRKKANSDLQIAILLPIEIVILSASVAGGNMQSIIVMVIVAVFLVIFLTSSVLDARDEVNFLEDFMEILFEKNN